MHATRRSLAKGGAFYPPQIRSGTGIGVFAPQFGPRRGFFAGVSMRF
ncbi:MAG: hypothetical protein ACREUL_20255 [Steroidobacteraceae bacterium]